MAKTPEQSEYTSIKKRIDTLAATNDQPKSLAPFVGNPREPMPQGLPFHLKDYIELVDWTGRAIRADKRGSIDNNLPPILDRLGIEVEQWLKLTTQFESRFKTIVGPVDKLREAAEKLGMKRTPNIANCKIAFG